MRLKRLYKGDVWSKGVMSKSVVALPAACYIMNNLLYLEHQIKNRNLI